MAQPLDKSLSASPVPVEHRRHYRLFKHVVPPWLVETTTERRSALRQTQAQVPEWFGRLTLKEKDALKVMIDARGQSLNTLEKALGVIPALNDFARPLLTQALTNAGYSVPVDQVYVRLYTPSFDAFGVATGGFSTRTLSLLQAALHNFEEPETQERYFAGGSGFITSPDEQGRFKSYATDLTLEAFTQLCRRLDIGGQYQTLLSNTLNPVNKVLLDLLRSRYLTHQHAVLKVDAQVAWHKGDIDSASHALIQRVLNGERGIKLADGRQLWYRTPCVMGIELKGCVIFSLSYEDRRTEKLIAWIPGDPQHPLKQYASYASLRDEWVRKLTASPDQARLTTLTPYQQFLSRYIDQKERPYYYKRLTELVKEAPAQPWGGEWFRSEKTQFWFHALAPVPFALIRVEPIPDVHTHREQAEHPQIHLVLCAMSGHQLRDEVDVWGVLFEDMRGRMFGNARNLAVPTADADANNRSARWAHYLNIGLFAVNLVAMAVPALGEVMMVVMVAQLLYETIEGIEEWSSGDTDAAWGHISDVVENLATLAVGGAAMHAVVTPVIEKLKVITLPGARQRLWSGDITPYAHTIDVPPHSNPSDAGLHRLNNQQVLPHEGKHYVLSKDPLTEHYRAVHPRRPQAYQPTFRHNGHGVWVHEGEQPVMWERSQLKRRLGPLAQGVSDNDFEHILKVCDVREDELRRLYTENEPTPLLLIESLRQFRAYSKAMSAVSEVRAGRISNELCSYATAFTVELPGWPASKAIELYDSLASQSAVVRYGNANASGADVIRISRADLMNGQLPERVVDALSTSQLERLLGERTTLERSERLESFRHRLSQQMEFNTQRLFISLYEDPLLSTDPARPSIELLQRIFPTLPTSIARRLVADANALELAALNSGKVPSRLMGAARRIQRDSRLSSAYLGLYLEGLVSRDTEMLVLNTLLELPGWRNDVRLEIRSNRFSGEVRASCGASDVAERKVLVRVSDGKYQAFDGLGNELHGVDNLYNSLQHALPDAHRRAIGLPGVWQGGALKGRIQQHALPREHLRVLLKMRGESQPFFLPPERLPGGRVGYPLSGRGPITAQSSLADTYRTRLFQLYPSFTQAELTGFLELHGVNVRTHIAALEDEFVQLVTDLEDWLMLPIDGQPVEVDSPLATQRPTLKARLWVQDRLICAWQRTGSRHFNNAGRHMGQALILDVDALGAVLETLPPLTADFTHVSKLSLSGIGASDAIDGFVSQFTQLRALDLDSNQLTRFPPSLAQMRQLEQLDLASNKIVLTPGDVQQISRMTQMRALSLDASPIGVSLDISRMPDLVGVSLNGCGLDRWPTGLLAHPRPRTFRLYLENNPLAHIPHVEPGSSMAGTLARTVVTRHALTQEVLARYNLYSESVGISSQRARPPREELASHHWISVLSVDDVAPKQALWNRIEYAGNAEPFFEILSDQASNMRYRTPAFQTDMSTKIWRMLEAMDESDELRDKLFLMAKAPFTCVDAGAQLFNALGVEVLLHEAYKAPMEWLVRLEVLDLARGKCRLDQLGRVARARVSELEAQGRRHPQYNALGDRILHYDEQGVAMRDIDEVEVYLTYTTLLADRLGLPWQSPELMFPEEDVTEAMTDSAHDWVRALEQGEGLRNQLLEQPMWINFIEGAYRSRFDALALKVDALTDLQVAQQAWVSGTDLSAEQKAALRETIVQKARTLGMLPGSVPEGYVMPDDVYDAQVLAFGVERRRLMEALTDEAMGREVSTPDEDEPITGRGDS